MGKLLRNKGWTTGKKKMFSEFINSTCSFLWQPPLCLCFWDGNSISYQLCSIPALPPLLPSPLMSSSLLTTQETLLSKRTTGVITVVGNYKRWDKCLYSSKKEWRMSNCAFFALLPHPPPPSAGRDGHGPWCQPRPPWAHCPPGLLRTSVCPVEWVRCMMRTRLFALKTALDSLQGFLPSSGTRYKSHKSCV